MRCETLLELLDDLEATRLTPSLEAEVLDHLAGCEACRTERQRHRHVAAVLGDLPAPALPAGFETDLERRIAQVDTVPWTERFHAWLRDLVPAILRYVAPAAVAACATVAVLYASGTSFAPVPPVDAPPEGLVTVNLPASEVPARVCDPSDGAVHALHVEEGEDVDVTLMVQTPEPMEGAKVYVVLPKGLAFSPEDHPELEGKRVMAFEDDFDEGGKDIPFTVRGTNPGKWDVTALVEQGDSLLLTGTTIVVANKESMP